MFAICFQISPKSDVWSLGCILYLLLYQKTPFAHIKNVYAKIQAVINPDKKIEFAALPNYYPAMLLEVICPTNESPETAEQNNQHFHFSDGQTVPDT